MEFHRQHYEYLQVKDLSLTGMFVKGDFCQRQMENCRIRIFHREKEGDNCIRALAEVVWGNAEGIGLKFTRMALEDYILLQSTLIAKSEQPEVILREIPAEEPFELVN